MSPSPAPAGDETGGRGEAATLRVVILAVFLDLLGFGLLIPVLPFYAESHGATPREVTWLGAAFSLMQFIFVPVWGRLSDRVGRRPVMLASIAASAVGYTAFGLAGSLGGLFVARMVSGIGNANIAAAQAVVADLLPPERRAQGMGMIGAAFGAGFVVGPALGGVAGRWGPEVPSLVAGALALGNLGFALVWLPETNRQRAANSGPGSTSWDALRVALRDGETLRLVTITFLYSLGFTLMEQVIGLYFERTWFLGGVVPGDAASTEEAHRSSVVALSWFLVAVGVTAAVLQGRFIGRLASRFGEARLARFGLTLLATVMVVIPLTAYSPHWQVMVPLAFLMASGTGTATPSVYSLLSQRARASDQGGVMGLGQSLSSLGRFVGPAVSGLLFEWSPGLPFRAGAVVIALTALLAWSVGRGANASGK